jgi:phosphatidylcholine synthase
VFVPLRYVYPSRTPVLRWLTVGLGLAWAALMLLLLRDYPVVSRPVYLASLVFPAYYLGLSAYLNVTRRPARAAPAI